MRRMLCSACSSRCDLGKGSQRPSKSVRLSWRSPVAADAPSGKAPMILPDGSSTLTRLPQAAEEVPVCALMRARGWRRLMAFARTVSCPHAPRAASWRMVCDRRGCPDRRSWKGIMLRGRPQRPWPTEGQVKERLSATCWRTLQGRWEGTWLVGSRSRTVIPGTFAPM